MLISGTEGFSPRTKPTEGTASNSKTTNGKPKTKHNAKFSAITTSNALLEELFREKFGPLFTCGNNSKKSNRQTQIFVTNIDSSSAQSLATDEDKNSGSIFMDYLEDIAPNDNVNIPIIFVIIQQAVSDNCSFNGMHTSQKQDSSGNSQIQNSFGSGQQSQSQGKNGYQSQQQSFRSNDQTAGKSTTTWSPIKFHTFAPMKPFQKLQKFSQ